MASPIGGFTAATPIEPPAFWSLQITGTAQGAAIGQALEGAVAGGIISVGTTKINATQGWQVQVNDKIAGPGDYLVIGTDNSGKLVSIALHDGPNGKYGNPLYSDFFTTAVPLTWAATTTAPVATLNPDGSVTLSFPAPTSADGPFTYTATGSGTVGAFTTTNGHVTVAISGLATTGTLGPWTVTVATQYSGIGGTSLPSNTVTVPTPTPTPGP